MISTAGNSAANVVKFVQTLLADEDPTTITPALINEKINAVLMMNGKWADGLDRGAVVEELVRRFSVWVGQDTTLRSEEGHEVWLNSQRKKDWRYWQRYREWLESKGSVRISVCGRA